MKSTSEIQKINPERKKHSSWDKKIIQLRPELNQLLAIINGDT
jgi:hypothetical protein